MAAHSSALADGRVSAHEFIDFFSPKPSPFPLVRIGGDRDGAYLVPDVLEEVTACFSPGVGSSKDFEDELLERFGIKSHLMDFSTNPSELRTPMVEGEQTFLKKWLSSRPSADSMSLTDWMLLAEGSEGSDFLLQMDIEGAEYENLLATRPEMLEKLSILVVEFHGVASRIAGGGNGRAEIASLVHHLSQSFVSVHCRVNNCCEMLRFGPGLFVPEVLEVTFLRRDFFTRNHTKRLIDPLLPHPLDIQRNAQHLRPIFLKGKWRKSRLRFVSLLKIAQDWMSFFLYLNPLLLRWPDIFYARLNPQARARLGAIRSGWRSQ